MSVLVTAEQRAQAHVCNEEPQLQRVAAPRCVGADCTATSTRCKFHQAQLSMFSAQDVTDLRGLSRTYRKMLRVEPISTSSTQDSMD